MAAVSRPPARRLVVAEPGSALLALAEDGVAVELLEDPEPDEAEEALRLEPRSRAARGVPRQPRVEGQHRDGRELPQLLCDGLMHLAEVSTRKGSQFERPLGLRRGPPLRSLL